MRQTGRSDPFWKKYGWSTRWMCFSYSQWADLGSKFTSIFDIICLRGTSVNLWSCSFISAWLSEKYSSIWSFSSSTRLPDWRTPFWKKKISTINSYTRWMCFSYSECADLALKLTAIFNIICLRVTSVNLWSCSFILTWLSADDSSIRFFSLSARLPDWSDPSWEKYQ